ncbi:pre-mRNA 3' end processing protein WDR33 isoform X4 [Lutra lutra]|uniref:pre-mRNA 3' end processing protein WDR33 isoform X4 n=1 Tax=Lutra lutra TaxID=9657 RepID=UPI001FD47D3B|nr:pre-mRNA 3' end processing protein WDR33 isoform X4 [Lutra lutra]
MATEIGSPPRFFHMPRFQHQAPRQLFYKRPDFAQQQAMQQLTFDGKRMRKAVNRKTIDYNPSVIKYLENRIWQRDQRDMRAIQPDAGYYNDLVPPIGMLNNPMNAVTTKFVRTSTNKVKCPVFVVRWTPEGRRLVTGASSGEFTLWNGLTFNFETILQAHDSPVRAMTWSHNDMWMLTADHGGYVKYWQSNMNNVKMFQAHKEAIREASFSPTDNKFATCSDDGTVRIWDFLRCHEERILRVFKSVSTLHSETTRSTLVIEQDGFILSAAKNSDHGDYIIGFGLWVIWGRVQGSEGCHSFSIREMFGILWAVQ